MWYIEIIKPIKTTGKLYLNILSSGNNIFIKNKKTKYVALKNVDINIYLFYWTNWSNKEGLQFREDIYNLDEKLYKALRN